MSHTVTIEPIGEQIEVEEGQTILAAALRQGVWLPFACGHGTCATCKVQVLEGDVEIGDASPFALMDVERGEGKVLACCATVESEVTIEPISMSTGPRATRWRITKTTILRPVAHHQGST